MSDSVQCIGVVPLPQSTDSYHPAFHAQANYVMESFQRIQREATGPGGYLDENTIFRYMEHIVAATAQQNPLVKCCYVDASFWGYYNLGHVPIVQNHTYFNRFEYNQLSTMIHVNLTESKTPEKDLYHWMFAAWHRGSPNFVVFDPLGTHCVSDHIQRGLQLICRQLGLGPMNIIPAPQNSFTLQSDGFNCGVISLLIAKQWISTGQTHRLDGRTSALEYREKLVEFFRPFVVENEGVASRAPHSSIQIPIKSKEELKKLDRRERDRLRKQLRRSQASENEKKEVKAKDRLRKQEMATHATQEDINRRNAKSQVRMAEKRKHEADDESLQRKLNNAIRMHEARLQETEEQTKKRLSKDAIATRESRLQETEEETLARQTKNAVKTQESRLNETTDQTTTRRGTERKRTLDRRCKQTAVQAQKERASNLTRVKKKREMESLDETMSRIKEIQIKRSTKKKKLLGSGKQEISEEMTKELQEQAYLGAMDAECPTCHAKYFWCERKGKTRWACCEHGLNQIPNPFAEFPEVLRLLFEQNVKELEENVKNELAKYISLFNLAPQTDSASATKQIRAFFTDFHTNIRKYNSAHSFASMSGKTVKFNNKGGYCYKIHGQIYHNLPDSARPATQQDPTYGQLFFVDTSEASAIRMSHKANSKCSPLLMTLITSVIEKESVFSESCKMMKEVIADQVEKHKQADPSVEFPKITMHFDSNKSLDKRRYNPAQTNEVAAVFVSADGQVPVNLDMTVHDKKGSSYRSIKFTNKCRLAMTYPLYFPKGGSGWHPGLHVEHQLNGKKITQCQFVRHMIAIRDSFNPILISNKLLHQIIVDFYVSIEQERLLFLQLNQKKLKAEKYDVMKEHLDQQGGNTNPLVGRTCILPSSFVGGPRYMTEHYQDAMALVREFGKPDLFVTFTCNPNWKEIKENLLPNQRPEDRPDLVARVFKAKLNMLMDDLTKVGVLGKVSAWLYVVEYQKRGLPHAHILLILDESHKIKTPADVDRVVSAEIPSSDNKTLRNIITKNMVHCCGPDHPTAPCMEDGVCTKKFPKEFVEKSTVKTGTFASPRRRNNGEKTARTVNGKTIWLDNRWVVPYNQFLSSKYDAHINVEICSSITAIKYVFKYVYKGHDRAHMKLGDDDSEQKLDEAKAYVDARYVSAPEAYWRINEYEIQKRSHGVQKLHVHLPDEQTVYFDDNAKDDELQDKTEKASSTLMAFFQLNQDDPEARKYYYTKIPEHYTYNQKDKKFQARKNVRMSIGRMYFVSMKNQELFYLRLLLLHVKGPTSFDDLKTVDGKQFGTFRESAKERGLLQDDNEFRLTLAEANQFQTGFQLRCLFATILAQCQPSDPKNLYLEFSDVLSEDWVKKTNDLARGERIAYAHLEKLLNEQGTSLAKVGLDPTDDDFDEIADPDVIDKQLAQAEGQKMYDTMNDLQKEVVDKVLQRLDVKNRTSAACFFVDGPGGSGKTYTYQTICKLVTAKGLEYLNMAFTGIAAQLLPGGRTLHSSFGLPLEITDTSSSTISLSSAQAKKLRKTDIFIVDEASMVQKEILRIMDQVLKDIMNSTLPFGGKVMLFGGDFRQILPVKKKATNAELVGLCLTQSPLWALFEKIKLTQNMRVKQDEKEFAEWLLKLGENRLPLHNENEIEVVEDCHISQNISEDVFGEMLRNKDYDQVATAAILAPTNKKSQMLNEKILTYLDGEVKEYVSFDRAQSTDEGGKLIYPEEFLNSIDDSSLPPHRLNLKKHCVVMLLRNLSLQQGLCNGTRLEVLEMSRNVLICKILTGDKKGTQVAIPRIPVMSTSLELPIQIVRHQFPVRLAYAMTINKSQGQTFQKIGIYLEDSVFHHGQLYVAFSRVTSVHGISLYIPPEKRVPPITIKNVVYSEVLQ